MPVLSSKIHSLECPFLYTKLGILSPEMPAALILMRRKRLRKDGRFCGDCFGFGEATPLTASYQTIVVAVPLAV